MKELGEFTVITNRIQFLLKELNYSFLVIDSDYPKYELDIYKDKDYLFKIFADFKNNLFFTTEYIFLFPIDFLGFITRNMQEIYRVLGNFGCFLTFNLSEKDIYISLKNKLYFSGINYESFVDLIQETFLMIEEIKEIFKKKGIDLKTYKNIKEE